MGLYTQLSQPTSAAPGGKQTWRVLDIHQRLPAFVWLGAVWPYLFGTFEQLLLCWTTTVSLSVYKLSLKVKWWCSMRKCEEKAAGAAPAWRTVFK